MSWGDFVAGGRPRDGRGFCAGAGLNRRASRTKHLISLSALLALTGSAAAVAEGAHGTIYSIHMIAKVPSICSLGGLARTITLDGIADDGRGVSSQAGAADFRIRCNVPYALDVGTARDRRPRGRMVPLSATFDPPAELIAAARGDEPAASIESIISPTCILQPHGGEAVACPDITEINDGARVAASTGGRIAVNAISVDPPLRHTRLAFLTPTEAPDGSMQETPTQYDLSRPAAFAQRAPIVVSVSGRL
jgi:hypothetical protein